MVVGEDCMLVEANPAVYHELGKTLGLSAKTWNTPALAGEYLLVRNDQEAVCYKLSLRATDMVDAGVGLKASR
jgi:outer membrane protein assembly factor BamB